MCICRTSTRQKSGIISGFDLNFPKRVNPPLAQKTPDQFELICEKCGTPDEVSWPEYRNHPLYSEMAPKRNYVRILTKYMCGQKPK